MSGGGVPPVLITRTLYLGQTIDPYFNLNYFNKTSHPGSDAVNAALNPAATLSDQLAQELAQLQSNAQAQANKIIPVPVASGSQISPAILLVVVGTFLLVLYLRKKKHAR